MDVERILLIAFLMQKVDDLARLNSKPPMWAQLIWKLIMSLPVEINKEIN